MRRVVAVVGLALILFGAVWWRWTRQPAQVGTTPVAAREVPSRTPSREPIRLSSGTAAQAEDHNAKSAELSGRVLSSTTGHGIGGAEITIGSSAASFSVTTGPTGEFHWATKEPGVYQLIALTADGFAPFAPALGHSPVVFEARAGVRLSGVTLYLTPAERTLETSAVTDGGTKRGTISGRVVDDRGAGVDNAQVVATGGHRVVARVNADPDGRFTLDGLADGKFELTASQPGWVSVSADDITTGARDVVLQLARGARIRGTVRDKDGKPVVAFSIVAVAHKGAVEHGESVTSSFFASDGSYELAGVRPGRWGVVAIAQDRAPSAEQTIDLTDEARADFTLARGASLRGRVIDAASKAGIAGARVALENAYGADTSLPLPVVAAAETDASGAFTLGGLRPGACSLMVTADGHHSRVVPGVRVDADQALAVVIDLTATQPGEAPSIESAGINVAVRADGDQLIVDRVSPGGGAEAAGVKNGDIIVRVAGTDVTSLGMQAAVEALRGPPGTTVNVTLRRPPDTSTFDLSIERRRIINR
jgi:hypothetical protein